MGDKTLVYKAKLLDNLNECQKHLLRMETAIHAMGQKFEFPIKIDDFQEFTKKFVEQAGQTVIRLISFALSATPSFP